MKQLRLTPLGEIAKALDLSLAEALRQAKDRRLTLSANSRGALLDSDEAMRWLADKSRKNQ